MKHWSVMTVPGGTSSARLNWLLASSPKMGSRLWRPELLIRSATPCGEKAPFATDGPAMTTMRSCTWSPSSVLVSVTRIGLKIATWSSVTVCENVRVTGFTELAGTPLTVSAA